MSTPETSTTISQLQNEAWAAWNASFHEFDGDTYRDLGRTLYFQAWQERVKEQLALLDAQNERLDALLADRYSHAA